jgi:methylated-DNA-[protein]-cysteine S-methyltransferase
MPTPFKQACYDLLIQVPSGQVTTYADIAHALGSKAYRAVGSAMNKNPNPVVVPCHRVVNSGGLIGNYAFGGERKQRLLEQEGILFHEGRVLNFEQLRFQFLALA